MTRKTADTPAKTACALDVLLKNGRQTEASVSALTQQFSSVMGLARADVAQLMKQNPGMHITEARDLHARAKAMSVVIARQFREQRLSASIRLANRPPTGIKGLVDGPTYTDMFNPDWANHCPPDAIEATTSPVAYLADLYRYAKELEATGNEAEVISLDARRPDLRDLVLDHAALNRVEPTIVLVNEILEKSIRSHLDGLGLNDTTVDDAMLKARYPNALPFERYTGQINYALGRKDRSLGDAIRAADPDYPYFKEPGVHSLLSDIALIQDTGLGPVQQGLLLEAPYFPETEGEGETLPSNTSSWRIDPRTRLMTAADEDQPVTFVMDNFGVGRFLELEDTQTFCLRTGLSTEELESLLSVGAFAPGRSANAVGEGEADGSLSGSVYINAGVAPAMGIETLPADEVLLQGPRHHITHTTPDRFDRMNRMIRLARWLDLSFDEVDSLLVASMQAEQRALDMTRRKTTLTGNPYLISQNTLRSLGLFQIVRKRFDVPAEDFAALLYGLSEYERGKTPSQFDRVFNSQAMFSIPLILDNQTFTVLPQTEAERQKIDHLCAALGMTFEVYRFVAKVVEQTYAGEPLRWSREVVSAFYRLVRLPRYLGLSTVEALALLELLDGGGSHLVSKLAGVTRIATYYASANTDTLSVIHALVDCCVWLKDNGWTVAQLCQLVLPSVTQPVATDAELGLLQQMHTRLVSALITDNSFAQVGAPDVAEDIEEHADGSSVYVSQPIDWIAELSSFIDKGEVQPAYRGLVKHLNGETEESFEAGLSADVQRVLMAKGLPLEELLPKIVNMVMRARGAQDALLMEGLAGYLNTSADLSRVLLAWAEGRRYELLIEVLRVNEITTAGNAVIGDKVLLVLEALSKRALIATHLDLSPAVITQIGEAPEWFGLTNGLSLKLVYFVSQYAAILRLSEQGEDVLLDYFRLINTVWTRASDDDKQLIRDSAASKVAGFLQWGIREVLAVAFRLNTDGVVFSLRHLDTLVRICLFSRHTSLDSKALLALYGLTPTLPTASYRQAAELALSCLTEVLQGEAVGEVGQSISTMISVTPDYLVAKSGEEATYTITVRDFMDQPIRDITINWRTDVGVLGSNPTTTDENGLSSITLQSGDLMGVAHVVASFGLGEELKAPIVTIDCDEGTIELQTVEYGPSQALSNKLEPVYYRVRAVDGKNNLAVDREVEWSATLGEFQRYRTLTDHEGVAMAELRSRAAGKSEVVASYSNGAVEEFAEVEFTSNPYFQYVRFAEVVYQGVEVSVECRVVELDGNPRSGVAVHWTCSAGDMTTAESVTDANGEATARFKADNEGGVTVTAASTDLLVDKTTELTTVNPVPQIVRQEAGSTEYWVGTSEPIEFSVWLKVGEEPSPRTLIEWTVGGGTLSGTSYSNKEGKASFSARFEKGEHTLSATVSGMNQSVDFNVIARLPLIFDATLTTPGITFDNQAFPDLIGREIPYVLRVKLVDETGNPIAGMAFLLTSVGVDPALVGVQVDGLGESKLSTEDGVEFPILASRSHEPADIVLKVEGPVLIRSQKTFRVGWVGHVSQVYLGPKKQECTPNINNVFGGVDLYCIDLSRMELFFTIRVDRKNFEAQFWLFSHPIGPPYAKAIGSIGSGMYESLDNGDVVSIPYFSGAGGYFVLIESSVSLEWSGG